VSRVSRGPTARNDAEMLCVVIFWALNLTIVKLALREMEPLAFNMVRFGLAAVTLLVLTRWSGGSLALPRADLARIVVLGVVGHTLYQLCFIEGLARTTASSVALIFGSSPVVVALFARLAGHERIGAMGAAGALAAFAGVALIVAGRQEAPASASGSSTLIGNLLAVGAVFCWAFYTVMCRDLLRRHSPLRVTALTLLVGAVLLLPITVPSMLRQTWGSVTPAGWVALVYSAWFALVAGYVLWYRSVKKVGNLRTAVYSNLVPILGTFFSVWLLGERLTPGLGLGAACIIGGIVLTRFGEPVPAE